MTAGGRGLASRALTLAGLLLMACGDQGTSSSGDFGEFDAGTTGPPDQGAAADFMTPPGNRDDPTGFPIDTTDAPAGFEGQSAELGAAPCYDGLDNDAGGALDCEDPSCRTGLRSCCVGDAACCGAEDAQALVEGTLLASCGLDCLDAVGFGLPRPFVDRAGDGAALAPGGDGDFDSGLVFGAPLDLAARRTVLRGVIVPGRPARAAAGRPWPSASWGKSRPPVSGTRASWSPSSASPTVVPAAR